MSYDELVRKWWAGRFPDADPPKWSSAITCADASDLLRWHDAHIQKEFRNRHLNPGADLYPNEEKG